MRIIGLKIFFRLCFIVTPTIFFINISSDVLFNVYFCHIFEVVQHSENIFCSSKSVKPFTRKTTFLTPPPPITPTKIRFQELFIIQEKYEISTFFVNIFVNNWLKHFVLWSLNAKLCYLPHPEKSFFESLM